MLTLVERSGLAEIAEKLEAGERLTFDDGVRMLRTRDLLPLGALADQVNRARNGAYVYFIQNRHINPTNFCVATCKFCGFKRDPGEPGGYTMTIDEVLQHASDTYTERVSEFHVVGGLHPDRPFEWYVDIVRALHERFPAVHIKAWTGVEIAWFSQISGLSTEEVLRRLIDAGLSSLTGGGAEIFAPRVRAKLCFDKADADQWLEVHRTAHRLGLKTTATMLYGHIETPEERVDHMLRLRDLQDETGGFTCFIPLAYHPQHNPLGGSLTTGFDDLRLYATARLLLDNVPHIKAYWIMITPNLAQISLAFGVSDVDGTVVEERIYHEVGARTSQGMTVRELVRLIKAARKVPVERDTLYNPVHIF